MAVREDGTRKNLIVGPVAMQQADRQERMAGIYASQLSKASGRHNFYLRSVKGDLPLMGASAINALRRQLSESLDAIIAATPPRYEPLPPLPMQGHVDQGSQASSPMAMQDIDNQILSPENTEAKPLMTSRYCILYELGLCRKNEQGRRLIANHTVSLHNNGKVFPLAFDCKNCTMSECYMQKK